MGRPSEVCIDLDALRANYRFLKQHHGGRLVAVVKADAYGHGADRCARALSQGPVQADAFGVAFVEEAVALREAGVTAPILVLEGAFDVAQWQQARQLGLWMVVHHAAQIATLEAALPAGSGMHVWLKLDTGMHRVGFAPDEARSVWDRLHSTGRVAQITWMSHLARADEPDADATTRQIDTFNQATAGLPGERSLSASAGLLGWPAARYDWARPGIALYGGSPLPAWQAALRPVMTLSSHVFAVREVAVGEAVGYGGIWRAPRPSRLGLVAMGYADGYPRTANVQTPLAVDGHAAQLAGRVSMDMLMVDLTDLPQTGVGSRVEFWGPQVLAGAVAASVGTIDYELLCGVKRVPVRVLGA
ncbi:alanine racemase [Aquabacterium sp.]|uniref:alanine racemase n=1 Tax=Aquabacterium sp. TaxID=1872578 RepID=UPI0035AEBDF1